MNFACDKFCRAMDRIVSLKFNEVLNLTVTVFGHWPFEGNYSSMGSEGWDPDLIELVSLYGKTPEGVSSLFAMR
jgi:hypothetical protein